MLVVSYRLPNPEPSHNHKTESITHGEILVPSHPKKLHRPALIGNGHSDHLTESGFNSIQKSQSYPPSIPDPVQYQRMNLVKHGVRRDQPPSFIPCARESSLRRMMTGIFTDDMGEYPTAVHENPFQVLAAVNLAQVFILVR